MTVDIFTQIMSSWFGITGDYTIVAMCILVFFILALVLVGVEIRFAFLFMLPLAVVFTSKGWFNPWFSVAFWILTLAIGGYLLWTSFSER